MLDSSICNRLSVFIEEANYNGVHLDNVLISLKRIEICNVGCKLTLCVNGVYKRNLIVLAGPVVVLTKCGSGMNYTYTLFRANVVGGNNGKYAGMSRLFALEVVKQGLVGLANKVCANAFLNYLGLLAKDLFKVSKSFLTCNEYFVFNLNVSIGQGCANCKTHIRGKCPRSSCPSKQIYGLAVDNVVGLELNNNPSVLTGTSGIRLSGIRDRERGFAVCTIGRYTVILVNKSLIVTGFKRPHNAFHKGGVHRFVCIVVINPTSHLTYVITP